MELPCLLVVAHMGCNSKRIAHSLLSSYWVVLQRAHFVPAKNDPFFFRERVVMLELKFIIRSWSSFRCVFGRCSGTSDAFFFLQSLVSGRNRSFVTEFAHMLLQRPHALIDRSKFVVVIPHLCSSSALKRY